MSFENDFTKDYRERSKEYMDNLDFKKFEEIKAKELKDLTEADFLTIGLIKVKHDELENLFCYEDLNGIKLYINKDSDKVELLGFRLKKEKDINSTKELLDEILTKWRLKME